MIPPVRKPSTVDDIRVIRRKGSWQSKTGGFLSVRFALSYAQVTDIFDYDQSELDALPRDIRGLRVFVLEDMPLGGIGCGEFHRIRTEVVLTTKGSVRWTCEDVYGGRKAFISSRDCVLRVPPFILHTIESLEQDSALFVIANTLFDPDDVRTQDSYPAAEFRALQEHYQLLVS